VSDPRAGDPDFASVTLLIHADTTITDISSFGRTLTAVGNAAVTTAQQKFGGGSMTFDGVGDRVTATGSSDLVFGSGEFTVEGWFRILARTTNQAMISVWASPTTSAAWALWINGNQLGLRIAVGSVTFDYQVAWTPTLGQWYHIAACRSTTATRIFVDGAAVVTTTESPRAINAVTTGFAIGAIGVANSFPTLDFNGQMDEIRITKGVARYTANFTPPTAAFPDTPAAPVASGQQSAVILNVS
jgi:hypothetical protein